MNIKQQNKPEGRCTEDRGRKVGGSEGRKVGRSEGRVGGSEVGGSEVGGSEGRKVRNKKTLK